MCAAWPPLAHLDTLLSVRPFQTLLTHHASTLPSTPVLTQCGPRFELKPYQIRLGTMDQAHAENEWVLRSYTRSAKKQRLAGDAEGDKE